MQAFVSLKLDPGTLLFSISLFGVLVAAMSWSLARAMPDQRAPLVAWGRVMGAVAASAFLLFFLRESVSWSIHAVAAHVLAVVVAALGHLTLTRLVDIPARGPAVVVIALLALSGVFMTYVLDAPWAVAVVTLSLGASVILGMTGLALVGGLHGRQVQVATVASALFGAMSLVFVARAVAGVVSDPPAALSTGGAAQVASLLLCVMLVMSMSMALFELAHELERQTALDGARRDGLTGVHTRTSFFELAADVDQAAAPLPYAIVMIDIDFFHQINDTHGHAAGDVTLSHAARLIGATVRISDLVGRHGGEEFCVLLRDCDERQATALAQRLVQEASRQSVRLPDGRRVHYTLSAGYAVGQAQTGGASRRESLKDVMARADEALSRAKREGRNRALPAVSRREPQTA